MSDVNCPYCDAEIEINHDDGYGYAEDETFEQDCHNCGKEFEFSTIISYYYQVFCKDQPHDFEIDGKMKSCKNCDHFELTEEAKEDLRRNKNE